ncbi:hydroxyisourate hydrolase [Lacisediminimonas profundi]|uniref:hydroxyisourate hydrolase n=1 Tax=Lacisediminimonas profundi TaxID=2603856 RepID=UPI00124B9CE9|nr:hydroxyisourate hydrolase [Lacisediminimonas profundi]
MGTLSTQVMDTANGLPAVGMSFQLESITGGVRRQLRRGVTNADGHTDVLLAGADLASGTYELHLDVAAYFRARGMAQEDPPFLDVVTVRFGIADAGVNHHLPLQVSPWSYSTHRSR